MSRPYNKMALDGKSYKAVFHPENINSPSFMSIEECIESEGLFIVREKAHDALACPLCTEGKACFRRSQIVSPMVILEVKHNNATNYFRLILKECAKAQGLYFYEHRYNPKMLVSYGYPFARSTTMKNGVVFSLQMVIGAEHFKNQCVLCPSRRFTKQVISDSFGTKKIERIECKGCWSRFYVVHCELIDPAAFNEECRMCGSKKREIDAKAIPGFLFMQCECKEHSIVLVQDLDWFFKRLGQLSHEKRSTEMEKIGIFVRLSLKALEHL